MVDRTGCPQSQQSAQTHPFFKCKLQRKSTGVPLTFLPKSSQVKSLPSSLNFHCHQQQEQQQNDYRHQRKDLPHPPASIVYVVHPPRLFSAVTLAIIPKSR